LPKIDFDMALAGSDPYTLATMVSTRTNHRPADWQISVKLIVPILCLICLSGCVRRRMTIRTNPPGAVVYVDDYQIGTTPVSANFVHYGTRKIRIVKDGYETLTVEQPIPAPWYQLPPIDFVAETLVPQEIRDHRTLNYQLVPQRVVPPDELRARAEDLRARAATPGIVPAAASVLQPPPGTAYGAPSYTPPGEPIPSPPPSGYGYSPSLGSGSQPVVPPPTTLPPSMAPQLPPGRQTLPPGGMPIR
jgi:PEGA domain-containing protein